MRLSQLLLPTERQPPADAEALSHKLMVRAGLVRQLGSGLWTWLPAGWRVHEKIVQVVREEMDAIGGQEMLAPVLTPRELWRRSGRDAIDEVFKLEDPWSGGDRDPGPAGRAGRRCGHASQLPPPEPHPRHVAARLSPAPSPLSGSPQERGRYWLS